MSEILKVQTLPVDALLNISSFLIGKPEELRLNKNKTFIKLQKLFKINYKYFSLYEDYNNDNQLCSLKNKYIILGIKLKLDLLLKQEDRLNKMFRDTLDTLMEHKDYDIRSRSFDIHFKIKMEGRARFHYKDTNVFSTSMTYEGEMIETYQFLLETKEFFESRMKILNEKEISKFSFIIKLTIN